jgi:hypothetical protein
VVVSINGPLGGRSACSSAVTAATLTARTTATESSMIMNGTSSEWMVAAAWGCFVVIFLTLG